MTTSRTEEVDAIARLPRGTLPYVLRRSPRSRRLRVTIDGRRGVIVSIPPASHRGWARPERLVESFLAEREAWIRRHLARAERARATHAGGATDGAIVPFRGEPHRVRVEPAPAGRRRSDVLRVGGEDGDLLVVRLDGSDRRSAATVLRAWLVERARAAIDHEIARHAPALGVAPAAVTLRDPRTRWGSATRQGRLSFSWRLVLAPPAALETVVVHELAHLRVFGHGPAFWALVATRRADHLEWRRWLRRHSLELHAVLEPADADRDAPPGSAMDSAPVAV